MFPVPLIFRGQVKLFKYFQGCFVAYISGNYPVLLIIYEVFGCGISLYGIFAIIYRIKYIESPVYGSYFRIFKAMFLVFIFFFGKKYRSGKSFNDFKIFNFAIT